MTPNKFHHAGLDWLPHIPGDQMPCPPDTRVRVLMRGDLDALCDVTNYETSASIWNWDVCTTETMAEIIGWHPIEEQPDPDETHCRAVEWHGLTDAGLRLRLGELTAQEIRTVRAVLDAIVADETTNAQDEAQPSAKNL